MEKNESVNEAENYFASQQKYTVICSCRSWCTYEGAMKILNCILKKLIMQIINGGYVETWSLLPFRYRMYQILLVSL